MAEVIPLFCAAISNRRSMCRLRMMPHLSCTSGHCLLAKRDNCRVSWTSKSALWPLTMCSAAGSMHSRFVSSSSFNHGQRLPPEFVPRVEALAEFLALVHWVSSMAAKRTMAGKRVLSCGHTRLCFYRQVSSFDWQHRLLWNLVQVDAQFAKLVEAMKQKPGQYR